MELKLFNTLTRKKETFKPIHKDWVGLYTCGPTVYNFPHIGNLRTYIFEDILERTLEYGGYKVKRVMNITDVGHLTGDSDAGEDKLDKEALKEKKTVQEIAEYYTKVFLSDLEKLNVKIPEIIAPATKFIPEQIELIKTLFEKGFAYDTPQAVYFDVSKFEAYGKLSGQSLEEKTVAAREEVVVDAEKRNVADFALWFKRVGKFQNHLLHWPLPWGEGFPGWHIECSAISAKFLGQPFDIHTGGVDHIGTHHTNEIAQSEAAFGKPLANHWMHGEFLTIESGRMGKSVGNFVTLADVVKKGFNPLVFRYLVLGAHYRTKLNFTWESLEAARNGIEYLYQTINALYKKTHSAKHGKNKPTKEKTRKTLKEYEELFSEAINDDLNTSRALAVLHETLNAETGDAEKLELIKQFDRVLGLKLDTPMQYEPETNEKIFQKFEEYKRLRSNKQFIQSDALRKEIEGLGYSIRDSEQGSELLRKFF